jgi:Zn-dependent protease/CBS domain-containing protein
MRRGLVIPIFGVRLRVTLGWIVVLAIVAVALQMLQVFPQELPVPGRVLLGGLVGLLFLVSLAAHELAHALVARRVGLSIREIGLSVIGTQGELEQSAPTGRGEIAIALAGPLVSLPLGAVALGVSMAIGPSGDPWMHGLAEVFWLVGLSNILVGALNLLPGHPFDGGRLVRGVVLWRGGDEARAVRASLVAGRLLAFAMMGVGIAFVLAGQFIDGIWLVVLGWLLAQSNRLQQKRAQVAQLVKGLHVSDVMVEDFPVVLPSLTVDALLAQHEQRGDISLYPVTRNDMLVGAVDIARVRRLSEATRAATRVEDVMTEAEELTVLTRGTPVLEALQSFDRSRMDALPVVDEDAPRRLVGLLTRQGLILALRARRSTGPTPAEQLP